MRTIIEKTYKPTHSTNPVWRVDRKVTIRIFAFDYCNPETGEVIAQTKLIWKHDTADETVHPMYHGCSYHFTGHNPTPVTDWFYGVPLKQMFAWCKDHHLYGGKCVIQHTTLEFKDDSWEATHPDF